MTKHNSDVLIHSFVWNKTPEYIDQLKIDIDHIKVIDSEKIYNDNFPQNYVRNRRRELVGRVPVKIDSSDKNIIYHITAGFISCRRSVFKDISIASKMYLTLLQGVFKDASKNVDVWVSRFTRIVSKVYANLLESWRKWFSNLLESCRKCFQN